ncbi:transmembrane prediction [Hymenobacter roseosalivarius DSM 11622]|uniref:Transmembrane prediction n=1 Tax=Hymenobacter roseosalivarius DSM 11622 TaxID=645990 RepID=A0A1W1V1C4_9BACT|nr:PmoA family protein [Hymenobacter roseosalivarius]SMB87102.1 transmembrane prediction [Hymenobacter roseosalivarius DSM 11622]
MVNPFLSWLGAGLLTVLAFSAAPAQQKEAVRVIRGDARQKKIDVYVGQHLFTSFLYPDTLEKPVLYPLRAAGGTVVTRGFPVQPKAGDPTDHPHHLGLWLNFENVNGLDFWNNSYAIPAAKKASYGWIKTDRILETTSGPTGALAYHANWTNQQNEVLLEETTRFEFSGAGRQRLIDRVTTLKANTDVTFNDAKDGLIGLRLAHELQMPTDQDQKFTDDKGNVTVVKGGTDQLATGNYLTSAGQRGNDAWSTRGAWCKVFGKIGSDSVSIAIIDHPKNPNYPTFWHARGYGLFAANPLGEKIFTNGKSAKNLHLKKGESVTFRYRVVIDAGPTTLSGSQLSEMAADFGKRSLATSKNN